MATRPKAPASAPEPDPSDAPESEQSEAPAPARVYDSNKRVTAYDRVTGEKLPYKVPETHLDGRFTNLKETPSSKAGK
ncbi:hypothetical protein [Arthrobacter sp. UYCu712]|uniref:hypothetical protein n=1 Tax=Arthrobacter sp. UYCu712 TaxID=3156340 RepID=UPI00339B3E50